MHQGACGKVGNAFPSPPPSRKKIRYEVGLPVRRLLRLETEVGPGVSRWMASFARAPLRNGAPPRPPCSSCTLLHTATRPPITQPAQETVLGSAVPSLATLPAPCFQGIHSGLRQVRFLRKLMPGEGFCMHVLCYLLKTLERYAVPAAIATCCPGSIRALLASRLFSHVVLCSSLFRAYSSGVLHLPHGPY